jgi:hypothetical protein
LTEEGAHLAGCEESLDSLRRLDEIWGELERLVRGCVGKKAVNDKDEKRFSDLMGAAQILFGRLSGFINRPVVELYGRRWEAIEAVLGTPSVSGLFSPVPTTDFWFLSLAGARSQTRQAIGRIEAEARQGRVKLSPDTVARWQRLIALLEGLRLAVAWLANRPQFLDPWLERLEGWRGYRVARVVSTFGGCIMAVLFIGGVLAVLVAAIVRFV